jgi:S-phase kinase-associated protein 1
MEMINKDVGDCDVAIPLPNVDGHTMEKIVEFMTYHHQHPDPSDDDNNDTKNTNLISPWDKEFCNVDQSTLFNIILVCHIHQLHNIYNQ